MVPLGQAPEAVAAPAAAAAVRVAVALAAVAAADYALIVETLRYLIGTCHTGDSAAPAVVDIRGPRGGDVVDVAIAVVIQIIADFGRWFPRNGAAHRSEATGATLGQADTYTATLTNRAGITHDEPFVGGTIAVVIGTVAALKCPWIDPGAGVITVAIVTGVAVAIEIAGTHG